MHLKVCGSAAIAFLREKAVSLVVKRLGSQRRCHDHPIAYAPVLMDWGVECRQGYTVQELYDQLAPEEVVHGTSGALPVAAENAASSHKANKQLFGQWISIVYMTFAKV